MQFCINSLLHRCCGGLLLASFGINIIAPALAEEPPYQQGSVLSGDVSPAPVNPIPESFAGPWVPPAPVRSDESLKLRAVPIVEPVKIEDLSEEPSTDEVKESRIFTWAPLMAIAGLNEARKLGFASRFQKALKDRSPDREARIIEVLESALTDSPNDHLKIALFAEKAGYEWKSGRFLKSISSWEAAWVLISSLKSDGESEEAENIFVNLLKVHMAVGNAARLKEVLNSANSRSILSGSTTEAISDARQILWHLENRAEQNIFCGFTALNRICIPLGQNPAFPDVHDEAEKARFIKEGLSVSELLAHSAESGGKVLAFRKDSGSAYVTPSVVHFTFGHYSALTEVKDGMYYLDDPHLKFSGWVSKDVLDTQTSGILIVPEGINVPASYSRLSIEESEKNFGRHCTHGVGDEGPPPPTCKSDNCPPKGMADYDFSTLEPGLLLADIPLSHTSPFGPAVDFEVSYFQRRNGTFQAPNPSDVGGMGPMWSHGYNSFIQLDGNGSPNTLVNWVQASGHYLKYSTTGSNQYSKGYESNPNLEWVPAAGGISEHYKMSFADGSLALFGKAYSPTSSSARYYLTVLQDPAGNKLTLGYTGMKLTSITNDAGQAVSISYIPETGDNTGFSDSAYRVRSVTDPFGRIARFKYTTNGRLWKTIDPMGITSEFSYGSNDFVTSLTTPYGTTKFDWGFIPNSEGANGRYIKATDPLGNVEYAEAFERVDLLPASEPAMLSLQSGTPSASVTIPEGGPGVSFLPKNDYLYFRNTFYWDKNAWYHAPRDYSKARIYNWLANGDTITGILGSTKMPEEGRIWYKYKGQSSTSSPGNGSSQPTKTVRKVETTAGQTAWVMDQVERSGPYSLPTRLIDRSGREVVYSYSPIDPSDIDIQSVKVKTGSGVYATLATFSNYVKHRPQTIATVDGTTFTLLYNDRGQVVSTTQQKGGNSETTEYTYRRLDGSTINEGYLTEIRHTDPANASQKVLLWTYTYDSARRIRTLLGPEGYLYTYDYDNLDRLTLITHPDATTVQSVYDRLDLVGQKNRSGEWNRTTYDALRRSVFSQDGAGRVTSYQWCLCGKIRQLVDPRGSVTKWVRDTEGRVLEKISVDSSKTTYSYQPLSGRLATITRPKDQGAGHPTISYSYDLDGQTTLVDYYDTATSDSLFSFKDGSGMADPLGRLLSRTDSQGSTTYSYVPLSTGNGAGKLLDENGPSVDDTIRSGYDWKGNKNLTQLKSDSGNTLYSEETSHDSLDRLTQTTNDLGTFTLSYGGGNLTSLPESFSRPNGVLSQFGWYGAGEGSNALGLKTIHHSAGGSTVSKFDYQYDLAGRISSWSRQLDSNPANARTWNPSYSRAGELTGNIEKNASGTKTASSSWNYDTAGNWYAEGNSTSTVNRSHDGMNRLTQIGGAGKTVVEGTLDEPASVSVDGLPASVTSIPGTSSFSFQKEIAVAQGTNTFEVTATDAKGNKRVQTYSLAVGGVVKSYEYDANGNMTFEKGPSGATVRSFEWDAADRLKAVNWGSDRLEWVYNGLGQKVSESANGTLSRRFQWNGINPLVERSSSGGITKKFYGAGETRVGGSDAGNFFYTRDHLGNIREVTDASGGLKARYDYSEYGARREISRDSAYLNGCDFGFMGHLTVDRPGPESGELVLTHYRAYDSALGRWLSPDPLGELGGINLNAALYGDPLNRVDPDGRFIVIVIPAIIIEGAAILGLSLGIDYVIRGKNSVAGVIGGALAGEISRGIEWLGTPAEDAKPCPADFGLPRQGPPGTTVETPGQTRRYGPDGWAETDRDYPHGGGKPLERGDHAHDWEQPPGGGPPTRGPARPPVPGDPPAPPGYNNPPPNIPPPTLP